VNVAIIRTFVKLREILVHNQATFLGIIRCAFCSQS
jgi:hypothetical protein